MKPYIVCHMASTVDGKIVPHNWPMKGLVDAYEKAGAQIKWDAWIVGRTTMEGFSSKKAHKLGKPDPKIPKTDFIGEHKAKTYAIAIDPSGKCRWDSNMVTTEHVVEVLTEKVSTAYLKHLREKQVSYIFGGKSELDLKLVLKKLNKHFGIKRARIDGGGFVNGSFLKAGLIDELSLLVLPIADGSTGTATVFDVEAGHTKRRAKPLRLKSSKKLKGGVMWLRYSIS